jgi:hypothetical protein
MLYLGRPHTPLGTRHQNKGNPSIPLDELFQTLWTDKLRELNRFFFYHSFPKYGGAIFLIEAAIWALQFASHIETVKPMDSK